MWYSGRRDKPIAYRAKPLACALLMVCAQQIALADSPVQVVGYALKNNLEIASAQAGLEASAFDKSVSITEFLPDLTASANTSWNESSTVNEPGPDIDNQYNQNGYQLTLTQTVLDLGRLFRFSQARQDYSIEQLKFEQTRQQIIAKTFSSYVEVLKLYARLNTTKLEQESSIARLDQIRKNVNAGNTARSALYEAQAKLSSVETSLVDLNNRIAIALKKLQKESGYYARPSFDIEASMAVEPIDATMQSMMQDQLQEKNLEILIAKQSLDKSKSALNEKRSSFAPTISADINYSFTDTNNASANTPPATGESDSTSYRLSINLPLFKGGERFFDIGKAKLLTEKSQIDMDNTSQEALLTLNELVLNINANANSIEHLKVGVQANYQSYRGQKRAYELGTRTLSDVLAAEKLLYDSLRDFMDLKYDYINNLVELQGALGTLELETINAISGNMSPRDPRERRRELQSLLARLNLEVIE